VHAKTLELMLNIGLVEEFMDRGLMASGVQFFVDGHRAAELNFADIGRDDTPYAFLLLVPQYDIEAILARDLERRSVPIEHNVEVTGFIQSADRVTVAARDKSVATFEVDGAYLIGADGAQSIVRKTLGLSFAWGPYAEAFLLTDCQIDWPLDYDHLKLFVRERSLAAYLPLKGRDVCRIIVIESASSDASAATSEGLASEPELLTLPEVQTALREATGMDVTLKNPSWLSRYRIHHRGVNKYGEGRVIVAGDAAHIHSPAGGQGMNTGLQDAANLCWKLAAVLKGSGDENAARYVQRRALAGSAEDFGTHRPILQFRQLTNSVGRHATKHAAADRDRHDEPRPHRPRPGLPLRLAARHPLPRQRLPTRR
jgi:2-polyprenyl-6-methoxyphenol hydroxylase-like FAD-dependent oxidoreductase